MEKLLKTKKDKEQFLLWLDFLKADILPQGRRALDNSGKYCCLGVGCLLFIPEHQHTLIKKYDADTDTMNLCIHGGHPKENAPIWLIRINNNFFSKTGRHITSLNDVDRKTFPEIADILYETYKEELVQ